MPSSIRHALAAALVAAAASVVPLSAQAPAAPQVSVGGLLYTQYTFQVKDTLNHVNNFDVKRAYVNVIGRFSGGVYARVTADIFTNSDSSRAYRIKYAYVQYTPAGSPLSFKIGEIHTPWLDFEETLWDYRMQGQMAMERACYRSGAAGFGGCGYLSAANFGAGVDGKWGPDKVNMQVTVVNDANYNKGTGDQRKWAQARVSVRAMDTDDSSRTGGLRVTAYADYGNAPGGGPRQRWLGMVSYRSKMLTLAGEAAIAKDVGLIGHVYSAFGVYKFPQSKAAVIGRVDVLKPQAGDTTDQQIRFIAGVSYQLTPNLRLLGDWDLTQYKNDVVNATYDPTRSQALFQTQFTF